MAGDWYGYFYNEANAETVFSIADVSGHGAGSAMFTAIIAATFEEARARSAALGTFSLEDFVRRLNRLIMKLGNGGVHTTLLMAKYKRGSGKIEFLNAGHTFPIVVPPRESGKSPESVPLRSDLLGMSLDFVPAVKVVPFPIGTSVLMYTDGLIEGSPDHRLYRQKRLYQTAQVESHRTIKEMCDRIYEGWVEHLRGQRALDDVCILAVRATSEADAAKHVAEPELSEQDKAA